MIANPVPHESVARFDGERPVIVGDSRGPMVRSAFDFLKAQRTMTRIFLQNLVLVARRLLNGFR